jgi:hypothetical protein
MADETRPPEGILLQVCIECGKEYMFEDAEPPAHLACERCGGTVFRPFFTATRDDEVQADFREVTERDTATDDGPTDIVSGDLADLGNL